MKEFAIGSNKYQSQRLPAFDQMVVAKRLLPVLKGIVTPELLGKAMSAKAEGVAIDWKATDLVKFLPAVADGFYNLSDEDSERIVRTCLKVVSRQNAGGAYSSVLTPTGHIIFDDIELGEMLQIAWHVIEEHLGGFFDIAR